MVGQASSIAKVVQALQLANHSRGSIRLICLFLISIPITLWVTNSNVTAESLFQSPASPVAPPAEPPAEQPAPTQPAPPQDTPTSAPPASAPSEQQAPATEPPAQQQPPAADQTTTQESVMPVSPVSPESQTLGPEETTTTPDSPARRRERQDPSSEVDQTGDSSNFILDEVEFIDSIVVTGAYLWLCCGVVLFLLVPIFMIILYVRGRSKISKEEGF